VLYIQHVCTDFLVVSGFWAGGDRATGGSKFSGSPLVTGGNWHELRNQVGSDPKRIIKPRNKKE
jgi:hypothetical protein